MRASRDVAPARPAGDAIHDMIRFVRTPVTTVGTGRAGSAATHIHLSSPRERRVCLPNTRFLIHQPADGAAGQAAEIAIQAEQILKTRERIARVIAAQAGQSYEKVARYIERGFRMSAQDAITYGIVSRIINHLSDLV